MAETTPPKSIAITKKYRVKKRTVIESVPVNSTDMGEGNNFWKIEQERLCATHFAEIVSSAMGAFFVCGWRKTAPNGLSF